MKGSAIICCLLLGMTQVLSAQPPPRRDTLHFAQWRSEITRCPVLTGGSQPIIIVANRGEFCFDKQLNLKMAIGRLSTEQTIYLDGHSGLVGILPPSSRGGAVQDIMPELEHFSFTVTSMKGNVYIYKNSKGKNGIEHNVSTGNTQRFVYQSPTESSPGSGAALMRKSESRAFCDNKITAQAYKFDGGPSTWFLYGDRFPEKLHPRKFFGAFGVGYMACDEGLFLVLELDFSGANYVRIGSIENVHNCFNPGEFQVMEDKFQVRQQQEIQEEQASIDRRQQQVTGDCTGEKQAIVDYKRAMNAKHEELLRKSQHGNTYQDTVAQRAMINMMDPLDAVREQILNTKLSICLDHRDGGRKSSCLSMQLSTLQDVESRMMALDSRYATEPARAQAEKSKIYWDLLKNMQNCN